MKKTVKNFALLLTLSTAALPCLATTSVKATVNGMVCAFCAQGIEKSISKMDATQVVLVDLKKKTVAVEAKAGRTLDEKAIQTAITEAGYEVVKLETVQQSVVEIKAQLRERK